LTETADNNGITNLMTRMLLKGNATMTAAEITERLDFLGATVTVSCFRDYSTISFVSLTENFDEVFSIIAQSVNSPTFPADELEKLKHDVEGDIKSSHDNQTQASSMLFWKTIYGDNGYGLPTDGTLESVARITVEDLKAHYDAYVGGQNLILSVATDLPIVDLSGIITDGLGSLKAEAQPVPAPDLTLQADKEGFISFDRNQSFIYMGYAMDHLDADEVPIVILVNEVMGGGVGARLWFLRQKEKLAYAVYTQYALDKNDAIFRAAIGTDTSKVKKALASLDREWDKLIEEGITEAELTDARINMKNNLIFSIDRKRNRANNMAYYEYIGYNYKYILDLIEKADDVTLAQVNNFIKAQFTDERKFQSIVGKS
jgi:zinc protease